MLIDWIIHVLEAQMRMYPLPGKEDLSNHIACKILTLKDLNPLTHGAFIGIKLNFHITMLHAKYNVHSWF